LDFQELKKQMTSQQFKPLIGCNEVKQRELLTGKPILKHAENCDLLEFGNPTAGMGYFKDQERVQ